MTGLLRIFFKEMKVFPWFFTQKISAGAKGFTMAEVLASLISLGVVVMSAQSVLMASNTFLHQSQDTFESMSSRNHINDYICSYFHEPPFVQQNPKESFYYNSDNETYVQVGSANNSPATLSYPFLDHSDSSFSAVSGHSAVSTFTNSANLTIDKHIDDEANASQTVESGARGFQSKFYDIYANSHTVINLSAKPKDESFNTDSMRLKGLGELENNVIIASRCIKNAVGPSDLGKFISSTKRSVIDSTDGASGQQDQTALYILDGLRHRPFYFPKKEGYKKIQCCDIDALNNGVLDNTKCELLEDYTPIAYVIKISSQKNGTSLSELMAVNKDPNDATGATSEEAFFSNEYTSEYQNRVTSCDNGTIEKDSDGNCYAGAVGQTDCTSITDTNRKTVKSQCKKDKKDEWRKRYYFPALREHFNFPVTFKEVIELPLIKDKNPTLWAVALTAPSKSKKQSNSIDLKVINIENQCKKVGLKRICPRLETGKTISADDASYLNIGLRSCHFNYAKAGDNTGGLVQMGISR